MYYSRMVSKPKSKISELASAATPACPLVEFYCAAGYKPDESLGYLMRRIISLVGLGIDREMEPTGLTNAQWVPLLKLYTGKASTVAELARVCELDAGSMTRLLDRLEAKNLCRRVRSSEDRRVVNLELTDAGRSAARGIPDILCRVHNDHLEGFTAEEFQVLTGYLRRILDTALKLQAGTDKHPEKSSTHIEKAPSKDGVEGNEK
jgi:DNA-binding MarR family transcriptional regulator